VRIKGRADEIPLCKWGSTIDLCSFSMVPHGRCKIHWEIRVGLPVSRGTMDTSVKEANENSLKRQAWFSAQPRGLHRFQFLMRKDPIRTGL